MTSRNKKITVPGEVFDNSVAAARVADSAPFALTVSLMTSGTASDITGTSIFDSPDATADAAVAIPPVARFAAATTGVAATERAT